MNNASPVELRRDGPVATVTLRRPEVHNAFNAEVIALITAAFEAAAKDDAARVVVFAAEGPSFSAGADLDWMRRSIKLSAADNMADAARLAAMLRSVGECPLPVVARMQGSAFGGGVGLVACADIAIAVDSARFGFTEARLGLVPATIAPWVVRKIGPGWAQKLFLTAERFDAALALQIGLVHQVAAAAALDAAVEATLDQLLAGGGRALTECKRLVAGVAGRSDASVVSQSDNRASCTAVGLRSTP